MLEGRVGLRAFGFFFEVLYLLIFSNLKWNKVFIILICSRYIMVLLIIVVNGKSLIVLQRSS